MSAFSVGDEVLYQGHTAKIFAFIEGISPQYDIYRIEWLDHKGFHQDFVRASKLSVPNTGGNVIIKPNLYEKLTLEMGDVDLEIVTNGEKIGTEIKITSPFYLQSGVIPGEADISLGLSVSVCRNASDVKALVPTDEETRIKHIVSELVRIAKKDRDDSRNRPERSKNKAVLEGISNALEAMAYMIASGEMFKNMPINEAKEDA